MTLVNIGVSIKTMLFDCTPMTYFVDVMSAFYPNEMGGYEILAQRMDFTSGQRRG